MTARDAHPRGLLLIVEDDPDIRGSLSELLEHEGYVVQTAPHGMAAIKQLESSWPAVVLVDLMMPVMGGIEFVGQVKRRWPDRHLPILVLTAADAVDMALATPGVSGVVRKPFDIGRLLDTLEVALGLRPPPR